VQEIRDRGVPGFEVDVIGTDMAVDRRLSAVAEVEMPFYAGLRIGIPSPQVVVEALADGRYDLVHVVSPGPAAVVAALIARISGLPLVGSHHTELAAYARLRTGDAGMAAMMDAAVGAFYRACDVVLSPSASADDGLRRLGIDERRIGRWDRGVDLERFTPAKRETGWLPGGRIHVLYAGRLTVEKGAPLLAEAFLAARRRDPRLHLMLAGGGPEEGALRARLGEAATFLGWLDGEDLARAYASADVLLFCSQTDTFGQAILEAQASGLPVVAVRAGGPVELVEPGRSGLLCPPDPHTLAAAVAGLAASPAARARLARGGLAAVRQRTWDAALGRLADGWRRALGSATTARRAA
jgi:glycosyltransferase involved in cell wall biosynthesis